MSLRTATEDAPALPVVAVEEHFWTPELRDALIAIDDEAVQIVRRFPGTDERLCEIGAERIERMDQAGVDVQVLSVTTPGTQSLPQAQAVDLARHANDVAADAVRRYPDRFSAFATLPTQSPDVAAAELRRAVVDLGMVGALIFPRSGDVALDHPSQRPIFEVAAELDVPLYVHPQFPSKTVQAAYYSGFDPLVNQGLASGGWGWHAEAGLAALRLVLAGTFDRHPTLQIMLGHWGEMLIAFLDRADNLTRVATYLDRPVAETISSNMLATAGGIYSQRMLQASLDMLGANRIFMGTDDPFQQRYLHGEARTFIAEAQLAPDDRAKLSSLNAQRVLFKRS